jgi:hypothetical protein
MGTPAGKAERGVRNLGRAGENECRTTSRVGLVEAPGCESKFFGIVFSLAF